MSTILCIDSATGTCSVAVAIDGETVCEHVSAEQRSHTEMITILIDRCIQEAGVSYDGLSAVAVIAGPGSYTSLRIGASTAKGLCYAHDIPLIGIDTLEHIVQPILADVPAASLAVAMLDARRMEVYTAGFYGSGARYNANEPVVVLDDFVEQQYGDHDVILVGDGASKTQALLEHHPQVAYRDVQALAGDMAGLAHKAYRRSDFVDVAYWEPNYIKPVHIIKRKKKLL